MDVWLLLKAAAAATIIVGIVYLNIWHRAHRAKLTPKERAEEDLENNIW
jgi:hypothetical protein